GCSPRTDTRSTRRWALSLCCPAPTASISILLRMQYSASHYAPAIVAHDTLKRCWSVVGTYGDLTKTFGALAPRASYLTFRLSATRILKIGGAFARRQARLYRAPHYRSATVEYLTHVPTMRAPVCAGTSIVFTGPAIGPMKTSCRSEAKPTVQVTNRFG